MRVSRNIPVAWLLDINRRPMQIFYTLLLLVAFAVFIVHLPWQSFCIFFPCSVVAASSGLVSLKFRGRPRLVEAWLTFNVVACMIITNISVLSFTKDDVKHRSIGINYVLWKMVPGFFGFRVVPRVIVIVASAACDMVGLLLEPHIFGTPLRLDRALVILVYTALFYGIATSLHDRLLMLYELQHDLAVESDACETLFSMSCDSKLLVAVDADTVLSTDGRVEQTLSRGSLCGERLSSCIPECQSEQKRVRDAFKRARDNPVQLPTSFVLKAGDPIAVELLIVRRACTRQLRGSESYSVGVRILNSDPALGHLTLEAESGNEDVKQSAAKRGSGGLELRSVERDSFRVLDVEQAHDAQSMVSTTITGQKFNMLSAAADLRDVEAVKRHARDVITLGKREHWLLPPSDVLVQPSRILGAGSFGVVVAAHLYGTMVAVKMSIASNAAQNYGRWHSIFNELRILRQVRHPNLVLFHGACLDPESLEIGLVFELVNGVGLDCFVTGPPSSSEFWGRNQIGLDVIRALRFLHAQTPPIVHSDLKPSNVMVDSPQNEPRAKLIDFGMTTLVTRHARTLGGTLQWLAPEAVRDPFQVPAPSSDVFSFGRLFHFVATGTKLLADASREAIIDMAYLDIKIHLHWPEDLEPLWAGWRPLCDDCVSNIVAERPSSMEVHVAMKGWPFHCDGASPIEEEGVAFLDAVPQAREFMNKSQHGSAAGRLGSRNAALGIQGAVEGVDAGKPKAVAVADSKPELVSSLDKTCL